MSQVAHLLSGKGSPNLAFEAVEQGQAVGQGNLPLTPPTSSIDRYVQNVYTYS